MESVLVVVIGSLLAILSAIHLFVLNTVMKELRFNRDDFYEKIERVIRLWEKRNEVMDRVIAEHCKILEQHGLVLTEHKTLLHLDFPTRKDFYKDKP